jgi:hypothetical protein
VVNEKGTGKNRTHTLECKWIIKHQQRCFQGITSGVIRQISY